MKRILTIIKYVIEAILLLGVIGITAWNAYNEQWIWFTIFFFISAWLLIEIADLLLRKSFWLRLLFAVVAISVAFIGTTYDEVAQIPMVFLIGALMAHKLLKWIFRLMVHRSEGRKTRPEESEQE